ncbi:MAG: transposase [Clostridia bacterium]
MTKAEQIKYNDLKAKYETEKNKNKQLQEELDEQKKQLGKEIKNANDKIDRIYSDFLNSQKNEKELKNKKKQYEKEIKELKAKLSELENALLDEKSKLMKNSENSSKPSSTEPYKVTNNRTKSGKNKGGQKGREGKTLNKEENVDEIKDIFGSKNCSCGGEIIYSDEYIEKQVKDIIAKAKLIAYRYHIGRCNKCGKKYKTEIPTIHQNPISYSSRVKSLIALFTDDANVSTNTSKELMKEITNSEIDISIGNAHNITSQIAKRGQIIVDKIEEHLKKATLANADETTVKIGNKLGCCINFSSENYILYKMYENKSKESFDEFGVFNEFKGILVHDHNKMYYKYIAITHAECNVHILRYLLYYIELFKRESTTKFREFLMDIYKEKLDAIASGKSNLSQERLQEIERKYKELLDEWKIEYEKDVSKYEKLPKTYREERNLFTRLIEYKEEHLLFIKNFEVPFSNNKAELLLRGLKLKMNVSKRFGKIERAKEFAVVKSIETTAKRMGLNVCKIFEEILDGKQENVLKKFGLVGNT